MLSSSPYLILGLSIKSYVPYPSLLFRKSLLLCYTLVQLAFYFLLAFACCSLLTIIEQKDIKLDRQGDVTAWKLRRIIFSMFTHCENGHLEMLCALDTESLRVLSPVCYWFRQIDEYTENLLCVGSQVMLKSLASF